MSFDPLADLLSPILRISSAHDLRTGGAMSIERFSPAITSYIGHDSIIEAYRIFALRLFLVLQLMQQVVQVCVLMSVMMVAFLIL